ncbi:unnamed protein product [Rotaria sp. Silwood1]|nr:unnamed protein product [Rotaria sp. Silwood1]
MSVVVQIIKYKIYSNNIKSEKIISYKDNLGGITHHSHALSTVILSITRYGCLIVFDYINNIVKQLCIKRLHQMSIRVCKINLNSLFVFTGSDDCMIKITNILNGICLYTLHNHQAPINTLAIDPCSGYPLAYVQHIIVQCSSSTSRLSCLLKA